MIGSCLKCGGFYEARDEHPGLCQECTGTVPLRVQRVPLRVAEKTVPEALPRPQQPKRLDIAGYAQALAEDAASCGATLVVGVMQRGVTSFYRTGSDSEAREIIERMAAQERMIVEVAG